MLNGVLERALVHRGEPNKDNTHNRKTWNMLYVFVFPRFCPLSKSILALPYESWLNLEDQATIYSMTERQGKPRGGSPLFKS
jgi:hypothetical protein